MTKDSVHAIYVKATCTDLAMRAARGTEPNGLTKDIASILCVPWIDVLNALLGSVDAAKLVHKAAIPGWKVSHAFWDEQRAVFNLTKIDRVWDETTNRYAGGTAKEPSVAWLVAILRAKGASYGTAD